MQAIAWLARYTALTTHTPSKPYPSTGPAINASGRKNIHWAMTLIHMLRRVSPAPISAFISTMPLVSKPITTAHRIIGQ